VKNDFMMAINQVCHERQLSLDIVIEAVEVALISAYRRNFSGNHVTAQIEQKSGEPLIFIEKAVVQEVLDDKNEISLTDALKVSSRAEVGGLVSIESTPANFGRIAAQTAKQVILQRIREAERDALYSTYAEREGEIVNGTVHKIDPHQVTLSLGKVEAFLPRNEQIPTERYSEGQRLRAYVASVSKANRGPQIIVSRTHRNMLRRLLEVEVPEIYNGTVEIKSIAREAGYRSKVAVAALQEGVETGWHRVHRDRFRTRSSHEHACARLALPGVDQGDDGSAGDGSPEEGAVEVVAGSFEVGAGICRIGSDQRKRCQRNPSSSRA
jgi:N utilization substance protein A